MGTCATATAQKLGACTGMGNVVAPVPEQHKSTWFLGVMGVCSHISLYGVPGQEWLLVTSAAKDATVLCKAGCWEPRQFTCTAYTNILCISSSLIISWCLKYANFNSNPFCEYSSSSFFPPVCCCRFLNRSLSTLGAILVCEWVFLFMGRLRLVDLLLCHIGDITPRTFLKCQWIDS